ncbi:CRISPR-associated protein Csx16 [Alkalilimnicola ehrlichii]|uniref:CRISPR-associated protein Csx16 n=1 Tax=Alkalilimnicola ehrlichii TaxID=351052 RepID=UPI003B9E1731
MTTWFVTRHTGAAEWARRQGLPVDRLIDHLEPEALAPGDTVIGTLPVHLAAAVCARGARYLHLSLDLPSELRGHELTADDMERAGARLESYQVKRLAKEPKRKRSTPPTYRARSQACMVFPQFQGSRA